MKLFKSFMCCILSVTSLISASPICVRGALSRIVDVKIGAETTIVLEVQNNTEEPVDAQIELFDHPSRLAEEKGRHDFHEPGMEERSNSSWVFLPQGKFTIAPKSVYNYEVKVKVPNDKDLEGTYYSTLMISPCIPTVQFEDKKLAIQSVMRYAVNVITTVNGNSGEQDIRVLKKDVAFDKTRQTAVYSIEVANFGKRLFSPQVKWMIYDADGNKIVDSKPSGYLVLPENKTVISHSMPQLPAGSYQGLVVFDQPGAEYFGAQCSFDVSWDDEKDESLDENEG